MRCPVCSSETKDGLETCETCGHAFRDRCSSCGQDNPANFKYCGHCGALQTGDAVGDRREDRPPGRGVGSAHAERRQLSVLYCDLVGSTVLAERLDPEDLRDAMRLYYGLCTEIVARFGGEVTDVAGDAVVAHFGYPQAYEDTAERTIRAGLALTETIGQLRLLSGIQVRVGISSGIMIVGDVIEAGRIREQELVGAPVNLAARLQEIAEPNAVVISAATRDLAGSIFNYEDLGSQRMKGFSQEVQAFTVLGEDLAADRFRMQADVALTPMVNREPERALLFDRWMRQRDKAGQVVLLFGEPGIGKTRLVQDLRDRIADDEHAFVGYACSPLHRNTPLYPVENQLRLAAGIAADDTAERRRAKIEALLERDNRKKNGKQLTSIAEMLQPTAGQTSPQPDPPLMRARSNCSTNSSIF